MKKLYLLLMLCMMGMFVGQEDAQAANLHADLGETVYSDVSNVLKEKYPKATQVVVHVGKNKTLRINSKKITSVIIHSKGNTPVSIIGAPNVKRVYYHAEENTSTLDFRKAKGYEKVASFDFNAEATVKKLILPKMNKLKYLWIDNNLQDIDLNNNKSVKEAEFTNTSINSISFRGFNKLERLYFYKAGPNTQNLLKELNLSGCTSLTHLDFVPTKVTSLDLSTCSSLKFVSLGRKIKKLTLRKNHTYDDMHVYKHPSALKLLNTNCKEILVTLNYKKKKLNLRKQMPWLSSNTTFKLSEDSYYNGAIISKNGVLTWSSGRVEFTAKSGGKKIRFSIGV